MEELQELGVETNDPSIKVWRGRALWISKLNFETQNLFELFIEL